MPCASHLPYCVGASNRTEGSRPELTFRDRPNGIGDGGTLQSLFSKKMNRSNRPPHQHIKQLLDLPSEAKANEVAECVFDCLSDALNCQFVAPQRLPGSRLSYRAAWLAPGGNRYEGCGKTESEAALSAALSFISQCEDAALLRGYAEPELAGLNVRQRRLQPVKCRAPRVVAVAPRMRRAGRAE